MPKVAPQKESSQPIRPIVSPCCGGLVHSCDPVTEAKNGSTTHKGWLNWRPRGQSPVSCPQFLPKRWVVAPPFCWCLCAATSTPLAAYLFYSILDPCLNSTAKLWCFEENCNLRSAASSAMRDANMVSQAWRQCNLSPFTRAYPQPNTELSLLCNPVGPGPNSGTQRQKFPLKVLKWFEWA